MNWNSASALFAMATILVLLVVGSRTAHAAAGCDALAVGVDSSVRERWPDLPATIRESFQTRADVDACARIDVAAQGAAITVTVVLPDGRTAARSVSRPEDILPALEALLLLPDGAAADHIAGTTAPRQAEVPAASPPTVARLDMPAPPLERPSPFRIEIDVAADVRAGKGSYGGGIGALLDIAHWLLGFQGRIERYTAADAGAAAMALELIALGGHRFNLGTSHTLDLTVGPAVALPAANVRSSQMVAQTAPTRVVVSQTNTDQVRARLIVGSRLTFRAQSLLRTFVQVDADVGEPGQPAWSVGLALGAAVGTR
ncbi:MAG: hypothetical protein ACJ8F1_03845 [Polyangia bacterium]